MAPYPFQLSKIHSQESVRDELRSSEQRVQVEPLITQLSNGQPVLQVITDVGFLSSKKI